MLDSLVIHVPVGAEQFDADKNEFVTETFELELVHSLVTLSKWESKYLKPFLGKGEKSLEETIDYVRMMSVAPNTPPEIFDRLTNENVEAINAYINGAHTATTFREDPNKPGSREIITSEIIYNWMIAMKIPIEWENRHLNRLFSLIKTVNVKQHQTPKKMSRRELMDRNRALNAQRQQQLGTRG